MGKRREPRASTRLQVTVTGTDYSGNPFTQTAIAHSISGHGVCIEGIECLQRPGALVRVQHRGREAQFRVIWIGEPGGPYHGHVGLQALAAEKNVWKIAIPAPAFDSFIVPSRQKEYRQETAIAAPAASALPQESAWPRQERRRYLRFACSGIARYSALGSNAEITGRLTDISVGGCYIEVLTPCPIGTPLQLTVNLNDSTIEVEGCVRTMHPTVGMGIGFTRCSDRARHTLEEVLQRLSSLSEAAR